MRRPLLVLSSALLLAFNLRGQLAPASAPAPLSILEFTLGEHQADLVKRLGPASHSASGVSFRTLHYNLGPAERSDEDFDWTFYFDQPSGELISVTRDFQKMAGVERLLTGPELRHHSVDVAGTHLAALSRLFADGRVLVAIGITKPTDPCSQLVLLRRASLKRFFPWIDHDLPAAIYAGNGRRHLLLREF